MEKRGDVNPAYTPDLGRRPARRPRPAGEAGGVEVEKLAAQGVQPRADEELRRAAEGR